MSSFGRPSRAYKRGPRFQPSSRYLNELDKQSYDFDLQVQLCSDLKVMPVNELTVEGPERLSPFVTVGRIHIPRQRVSGVSGEDLERADALAFNQWRVTAQHAPLGEIMHVRKIYTTSANLRRVLNHQPQAEPATAAKSSLDESGTLCGLVTGPVAMTVTVRVPCLTAAV